MVDLNFIISLEDIIHENSGSFNGYIKKKYDGGL